MRLGIKERKERGSDPGKEVCGRGERGKSEIRESSEMREVTAEKRRWLEVEDGERKVRERDGSHGQQRWAEERESRA